MLLDTSGLFCLLHHREPEHAAAKSIYSTATDRLTHNYILDELVSLTIARRGSQAITLAFSQKAIDDRTIEVVWIDEELHRRAP